VIAAGSYIDPDVLLREISDTGISSTRILVDPDAVLIQPKHCQQEQLSGLRERIGSTLSGTGAAVAARVQRDADLHFANEDPRLSAFVRPAKPWLRARLHQGERVIIEGTQGFGLSLLHSGRYPHVTSRDTTAGAFVAEAGLSPLDVDEIALVIRTFPIRVAGASGDLPREIDWETVTRESGSSVHLIEKTSVTHRVRRVARFDPEIVRRAVEVNAPSLICLNHIDYVDARCAEGVWTPQAEAFVAGIEMSLGRVINYVGTKPGLMVPRPTARDGLVWDERTAATV
jgi:adenylosuccinate synthase